MADICPFRGLRFSSTAGVLERLVAPPYDVMTPAERNGFAAKSEHNIVHLTLPEGKIDDRSKFIKYARASALLGEWRRDGSLVPDEKPSFYRYTQKYEVGNEHARFARTSLICLLKVEPFEKGTVLPHEQTFPSHKEDRLRLLEATRTHLESIFGVYEDPDGSIHRELLKAPVGAAVEATTESMTQTLEPISDPETVAALKEAFATKRIWIADGHHRYETALGYRQGLGEKDHPIAEDYIVIALVSIADPGLILMPTHRIVPALKNASLDELEAILATDFTVERCHSSRLTANIAEAERNGTHHVFGIALEGGHGLWLTARDPEALSERIESAGSLRLRQLDTTILHKIIFEQMLGLPTTANMEFTREAFNAIATADRGGGAAFLMAPPTIDDMKEIALAGERMPHKSTYYYPKIWSGFVSWGFEDIAE